MGGPGPLPPPPPSPHSSPPPLCAPRPLPSCLGRPRAPNPARPSCGTALQVVAPIVGVSFNLHQTKIAIADAGGTCQILSFLSDSREAPVRIRASAVRCHDLACGLCGAGRFGWSIPSGPRPSLTTCLRVLSPPPPSPPPPPFPPPPTLRRPCVVCHSLSTRRPRTCLSPRSVWDLCACGTRGLGWSCGRCERSHPGFALVLSKSKSKCTLN